MIAPSLAAFVEKVGAYMAQFAMCFPGQGSQSVGMLRELSESHPEVEQTLREASDALDYDLGALVREGPEEQLNRTECTQPALLAAGVAVWRVWQASGGGTPAAMAGHSLGEYAALVAAGSLEFSDGVRLSALRGRAMQAAVPEGKGGMAAVIGLDDETVTTVCDEAAEGAVLSPANFNAPGQVVIAGATAAVERAMPLAKQRGAKMVKQLPVSVPSHCALMGPATEQLREALASIDLQTPQTPVLHNVDAQPRNNADGIREALVAQLEQPVLWTTCFRALRDKNISIMLECGPGKVLTGLARRIDKGASAVALHDEKGMEAGLAALA